MDPSPPDDPTALQAALGESHAHLGAGRLREAEAALRRVLALRPDHADSLHNLGLIAYRTGHHASAIELILGAIRADPANPAYHSNLGEVYRTDGRANEAAAACREAIRLRPAYAEAHVNLGNALQTGGDMSGAAAAYARATELKPDYADAHNNLGTALKELGETDAAVAAYRRAIELRPDHADAHYNLGNALNLQGAAEDAAAAYARAIELKPDYIAAYNNLGNFLQGRGRLDEAAALYRRALELEPEHVEALNNLGNTLKDLGRHAEALALLRRALAVAPENPAAHYNAALLLMSTNNFAEGWIEHEWRWRCDEFPFPKRPFAHAEWDGSPIEQRTVLVWGEQGVGDEIMFAGLIPEIMTGVGHCLIECAPRLVPLFARSFPGAKMIARTNPPDERALAPDIDVQVAMGSLGRWLRPSPESFGRPAAYLRPDAGLTVECRRRYQTDGANLVVGISWRSGNQWLGESRSASLDLWGGVLAHPGIRFVNLQYGDYTEDLATVRERLGVEILDDNAIDPLESLDDFAAQVAAVDLVISIDNSTVHMAGALGVPVWTLLPFAPDWRWRAEGDDSLWYASMRLFRQPSAGNWTAVFEAVSEALADCRQDPDRLRDQRTARPFTTDDTS